MSSPPYRKVHLFAAANTRTGGPEAMHQLGRALLDLGHDVAMVYTNDDTDVHFHGGVAKAPDLPSPMPAEYAHYNVPRGLLVPDEPDHAVVVPEVWPALATRFARSVPHLWWLSIDNARLALERAGGLDTIRPARFVHLCQSYYAMAWLTERRLPNLPLFDYTSPDKLAAAGATAAGRKPRILYPARGRWFTEYLRRWAPGLDWQEISGFTPDQVRDLFLTSRLYADFGKHPGKDRMPREAAILGCCIVTGQRGAAANPLDIPIPAEYKFRDSRLLVPRIAGALRRILVEYDTRMRDFDLYRDIIRGEQREFLLQVMRVFGGRLNLAGPVGG